MNFRARIQCQWLGELLTAVMLVAWTLLLLAVPGEGQYRYDRVELRRMVDGDTVRLDIETEPGRLARNRSCRLLRMDAPEMTERDGEASRMALVEFLRGKKLSVEVRAVDRYGRWLIELWASGEIENGSIGPHNVSDWMVEHGHAKRR